METPSRRRPSRAPETPRSMGARVVCATPRQGHAVSNYSLGDRLGKGAFATVYKAIHLQTAEIAAVKQIPLAKIKSVDSIMGEIELLRDLEHPNIVKYFGFMKDDQNLNIVLEYCENGSLASILHKFGVFPESLLAKYMHQVLEGLNYLHRQGTIHRDIKGANILTTKDGVAKLADFGVATKIVDELQQPDRVGAVGTPHWMAPEIIKLQMPTPACDVWSLGATIVELRTGQPPYGDRADIPAMYAIVQQDATAIIPVDSTGSLKDFLVLCFEKDPTLRVGAQALLKHPWVTKFCSTSGVESPERAVQEWNSPSRRRKLAVPSKLNLRSGMKRKQSFEDDFDSLGMFGEAPKRVSDGGAGLANDSASESVGQVVASMNGSRMDEITNGKEGEDGRIPEKLSPRKPLEAFVERSEDYEFDWVDSDGLDGLDNDGDLGRSLGGRSLGNRSPGDPNRGSSKREGLSALSKRRAEASSEGSSFDVFRGLDDLDDSPDEAVLCAQCDAKELINSLFAHECDTEFAFRRLSELVCARPAVRRTLEETRLLPRVLSLLREDEFVSNHVTKRTRRVYESFTELVGRCIPDEQRVTNFCIAGGLSFVLAHAKLSMSRCLELVYKMCNVDSSIAHMLAFREDAITVVCSFFRAECSELDLLRASTLVLEMFGECGGIGGAFGAGNGAAGNGGIGDAGGRSALNGGNGGMHVRRGGVRGGGAHLRASLWYHFNAYNLFHWLVSLLHTDALKQPDVARNFYELVESYSRAPQQLLTETVDEKTLRRLMRAYILLPVDSEHRGCVLGFFKTVSVLPSVLDAMQRAKVVPHLIAALRRALHDPSITETQCYMTMNLLVPTLFSYARLDRSRQAEIAHHGLLPLLQDCVRRAPRLREFAFPIFSAVAHSGVPQCWKALAEADALTSFIDLVTQSGWQEMAISAISAWALGEPKLLAEFTPHLQVINDALLASSGLNFEHVLAATYALLNDNPALRMEIPLAGLLRALQSYLSGRTESSSMVSALQIVCWVSRQHRFAKELEASGLANTLKDLVEDPHLPIMCVRLIALIEKSD